MLLKPKKYENLFCKSVIGLRNTIQASDNVSLFKCTFILYLSTTITQKSVATSKLDGKLVVTSFWSRSQICVGHVLDVNSTFLCNGLRI